jgi:predicted RNA binding protein YcfA (HicA-like mRNA interferase family)
VRPATAVGSGFPWIPHVIIADKTGLFSVGCRVLNPVTSKWAAVRRLMVDAAAESTWINATVLEGIGVERRKKDLQFQLATGSHQRWVHTDGRAVTIPIHGGPAIGPPLYHRILQQLGISVEEFRKIQ